MTDMADKLTPPPADAPKEPAKVPEVKVVAKTEPRKSDFFAAATVGGAFKLLGAGFGSSGTIKVNGQQVETTSWSAQRIEGRLPKDVRSGEVTIHLSDNRVLYSRF